MEGLADGQKVFSLSLNVYIYYCLTNDNFGGNFSDDRAPTPNYPLP